ncbi:NADH dehydrogenase [ubiquinone] 1 alpha subcomplex assembly factor 4 [Protopterus annectens]|uniref:NADH dehydrogenase [ubiquinone] 1 alpha subcomplex assembly factor 4 n=1 Tax=Protopterus annectens TaxID=7888 RepID=UPI001CFA4FDF|nr:NADH dehydrogenase [ubiquinone] 1 alpha subcomplex assembly factor 4 [Protopterus annectens]
MGGRITRVFRNFNLENRIQRELSKQKPTVAPLYPTIHHSKSEHGAESNPKIREEVLRKDEELLSRLRMIYVTSADPPAQVQKEKNVGKEEHRLPKSVLHGDPFGTLGVKSIPKGKLSVLEAVTLLDNHKRSPKEWTTERIAKEYTVELNHVISMLHYFIPFNLKIIPSKEQQSTHITAGTKK